MPLFVLLCRCRTACICCCRTTPRDFAVRAFTCSFVDSRALFCLRPFCRLRVYARFAHICRTRVYRFVTFCVHVYVLRVAGSTLRAAVYVYHLPTFCSCYLPAFVAALPLPAAVHAAARLPMRRTRMSCALSFRFYRCLHTFPFYPVTSRFPTTAFVSPPATHAHTTIRLPLPHTPHARAHAHYYYVCTRSTHPVLPTFCHLPDTFSRRYLPRDLPRSRCVLPHLPTFSHRAHCRLFYPRAAA